MVAVAGHDEHIDAVGDRADHLAFDTTAPAHQLGVRMSEANRSGSKQLRRLVVRDVIVATVGFAPRKAAAEQSRGCCVGSLGDIRRRDMEKRESRIGGEVLDGRVDASLPRSLDHPDDDPHGRH